MAERTWTGIWDGDYEQLSEEEKTVIDDLIGKAAFYVDEDEKNKLDSENQDSRWVFLVELIAKLEQFLPKLDSVSREVAEQRAKLIGFRHKDAVKNILEKYFVSERFSSYRHLHWYFNTGTTRHSDFKEPSSGTIAQNRRLDILRLKNLVEPAVLEILSEYEAACADCEATTKVYVAGFILARQPCQLPERVNCPFAEEESLPGDDDTPQRDDICLRQMLRYWHVRRISRFLENIQSVRNSIVQKVDANSAADSINVVKEYIDIELPHLVKAAVDKATDETKDNFYSNLIQIMAIFAAVIVIVVIPIQFIADIAGKLAESLGGNVGTRNFIVSVIMLVLLGSFQLVAFLFYIIRNLLWERRDRSPDDDERKRVEAEHRRHDKAERAVYVIVTAALLLGLIGFAVRGAKQTPDEGYNQNPGQVDIQVAAEPPTTELSLSTGPPLVSETTSIQ